MLHEESRPFLPTSPLVVAEEGIEELVRRIIRSTQQGVNTSRANVASIVSTPDEELRRRFKKIGSIRKKAEQALVGALVKHRHRPAERLTNKLRKLEHFNSINLAGILLLSRRLTRKRNHRLERKLSTKVTM